MSCCLEALLMVRLNEIKAMADRLRSVRDKLFDVIANKLKTPGQWLHIKRATGMYWYVTCRLSVMSPEPQLDTSPARPM